MSTLAAGGPVPSRRACIALGSNLGDRAVYLAVARRMIAGLPGTAVRAMSPIEETAPLGNLPQPRYLNQMLAIETSLEPLALLDALHAIERAAGRERRERWGPRELDLDIVTVDGEIRNDPVLTLPHPGLADRDFWQRGIAELHAMPVLASPHAPAPPAHLDLGLPPWAVVSATRRAHIARVTALLDSWAGAMGLDAAERDAWRDAGRWHDALRDADAAMLRTIVPQLDRVDEALHGPAAAVCLAVDGERRQQVLDAVEHHTVGAPEWARTGRALYMADFLEPGRDFAREARAEIAARVPADFEGAFRDVVRLRIEAALRGGFPLHPASVAMWNALR